MIWVALEVGATAWDVSVLCGAGGGLLSALGADASRHAQRTATMARATA